MSKKIEFIESYIKGRSGYDYIWSDNHGELIRCCDCRYWNAQSFEVPQCTRLVITFDAPAEGYCFKAVKKDDSSSEETRGG